MIGLRYDPHRGPQSTDQGLLEKDHVVGSCCVNLMGKVLESRKWFGNLCNKDEGNKELKRQLIHVVMLLMSIRGQVFLRVTVGMWVIIWWTLTSWKWMDFESWLVMDVSTLITWFTIWRCVGMIWMVESVFLVREAHISRHVGTSVSCASVTHWQKTRSQVSDCEHTPHIKQITATCGHCAIGSLVVNHRDFRDSLRSSQASISEREWQIVEKC